MKDLFKINITEIKSAFVTTFLTAVLSMSLYIIGIGDIFLIDVKVIINVGVISALTGLVSIIKSFLTTSDGNFIGSVKIK
jgi:hypothetical protein